MFDMEIEEPANIPSHAYLDQRKTRGDMLKELGFDSYAEYLDSDLWRSIRERVFYEKGRRCTCCSKMASQVHHAEYTDENLAGDNLDELFPVCGECHRKTHFKRGKFRSQRASKQSLNRRKNSNRGKSKRHKQMLRDQQINDIAAEQNAQYF